MVFVKACRGRKTGGVNGRKGRKESFHFFLDSIPSTFLRLSLSLSSFSYVVYCCFYSFYFFSFVGCHKGKGGRLEMTFFFFGKHQLPSISTCLREVWSAKHS